VPRWVIDESRLPLLIVHLDDPSGRVAPDFESLYAVLARVKVVAQARTIYVILDLTGAQPDAERRRRLAEWLRVDAVPIRPRVAALAVVAPSPFLRGTITAISWLMPERMMHSEVVESRAAAVRWMEPKLKG